MLISISRFNTSFSPHNDRLFVNTKEKNGFAGKLENKTGPHRLFLFFFICPSRGRYRLRRARYNQKREQIKQKQKKLVPIAQSHFLPYVHATFLCFVLCNPSYVTLLCVRVCLLCACVFVCFAANWMSQSSFFYVAPPLNAPFIFPELLMEWQREKKKGGNRVSKQDYCTWIFKREQ